MPSVLSSVTAVKNNILLVKLLETLKDRVSFKAVNINNNPNISIRGFHETGLLHQLSYALPKSITQWGSGYRKHSKLEGHQLTCTD